MNPKELVASFSKIKNFVDKNGGNRMRDKMRDLGWKETLEIDIDDIEIAL